VKYRCAVINAGKRARDADRDATIEVVEAAYADGQITREDYDRRADLVLRARTLGDLHELVHDLQAPAGAEPLAGERRERASVVARRAAPRRRRPRTSRVGVALAGGGVVAALAASLVIGAIGSDRTGTGPSAALLTADGYDDLTERVVERFGSDQVFEMVVYPEYAVVRAPVDATSNRYRSAVYHRSDWTDPSTGTAGDPRFPVDQVAGRVVAAAVDDARGRIEKPTTSSAVIRARAEDGTCVQAFASNEFSETATVSYRCDGTVVSRRGPS